MNNNLKVRALVIVVVLVVCVYFIIGIPKSKAEILANWNSNIHLGLDLRGGSQLVLRVNLQDAFKATADAVIDKLKDTMRTGGDRVHGHRPQRSANAGNGGFDPG